MSIYNVTDCRSRGCEAVRPEYRQCEITTDPASGLRRVMADRTGEP